MYRIVTKKLLAPNIYFMDIEAGMIARSAKPGQFVIIRTDEKGERIPLTICDYDKTRNTVAIVFQTVGASTKKLARYEEGDSIADIAGPLGQPSEYTKEDINELRKKKIIFVAGGVGSAPVYPQVKWLKEHGVYADVIIGAKSKNFVLLENEMKSAAGNVYVATDDGSYGYKGLVTNLLSDLVKKEGKKYDLVVAIGPMIMMKFVAKLTKELGIKTVVSLNTIMVDGTGMCGACRVTVGNEVKFACVDGPEFDASLVDFDEAMRRQTMYKTEEAKKLYRDNEDSNKNCPMEKEQ